jgi:hypothetical protein
MKRSAAILFCLIFSLKSIFPSFELSNLVDVPELLSHYRAHKAENSQITFIQFIHLHYDSDSEHFDDDPRNHQKLPFSKHHFHFASVQIMTDLNRVFEWSFGRSFLIGVNEVRYFESSGIQLVSMVWQPPRA